MLGGGGAEGEVEGGRVATVFRSRNWPAKTVSRFEPIDVDQWASTNRLPIFNIYRAAAVFCVFFGGWYSFVLHNAAPAAAARDHTTSKRSLRTHRIASLG